MNKESAPTKEMPKRIIYFPRRSGRATYYQIISLIFSNELIICPTQEIANQVNELASSIGKDIQDRIQVIQQTSATDNE